MGTSNGANVVPVVDEGLGNTAYVVDLGDGRALVVDASRDLRAVRRVTAARTLRPAFAADTHLHADFLSGAVELAASDGASVLASRAGDRAFPHRGLADGDEVDLGGLRLRVLGTPGHTDEHLAFLLLDGDDPLGVFTGGSLIVGAVARTDLVDPARTEELARAQYRSVQRLLTLPDDLPVWPTHGTGSFCSAPRGAERTTTIGRERATNPLVAAPDEDAFVAALLDSLGSFPAYFLRLGEANRVGPPRLGGVPNPPGLAAHEVEALVRAGAVVVDVRPVPAYAEAHLPGSLSIPLRDAFATWLGWVAPPATQLVVVRDHDQDLAEVFWQAAKIGYDTIAGELLGGVAAWAAAGLPLASTSAVRAGSIGDAPVLDVRQRDEFESGHVPGAAHVELGDLAARAEEVPRGPLVVMCGHGERAATAASLLERNGRNNVSVLLGGPDDVAADDGLRLEA